MLARDFRRSLHARLKQAKAEGDAIYAATLKSEVSLALPGSEEPDRRSVLLEIVQGGGLPSDAAARIAAKKFNVPLREVKSGRGLPAASRRRRPRLIVAVADIESVEAALERRRRGGRRKRRPAS
jgi:hypothetical protein